MVKEFLRNAVYGWLLVACLAVLCFGVWWVLGDMVIPFAIFLFLTLFVALIGQGFKKGDADG